MSKAEILFKCFEEVRGVADRSEDSDLMDLCSAVANALTDEEFKFMIGYMKNPHYKRVYSVMEEALLESLNNKYNNITTFDDDDTDKYGMN